MNDYEGNLKVLTHSSVMVSFRLLFHHSLHLLLETADSGDEGPSSSQAIAPITKRWGVLGRGSSSEVQVEEHTKSVTCRCVTLTGFPPGLHRVCAGTQGLISSSCPTWKKHPIVLWVGSLNFNIKESGI